MFMAGSCGCHRTGATIGSVAPRALLLASTLLLTACGSSATPGSAPPTRQNAALAFSRCMRSHGVPSFPDPTAQGDFPPFRADVSKPISAAADHACRRLLSKGSSTGTPQQRQQKFAFALKVAQCVRVHGFPGFPDPSPAHGTRVPPDIDVQSPQFQALETACEQHARQALGLP
jgi:hypothetical protein